MSVRVYVGASEEHDDVAFTVCGLACVCSRAAGVRQPVVRLQRAFRCALAPQWLCVFYIGERESTHTHTYMYVYTHTHTHTHTHRERERERERETHVYMYICMWASS